MSSLRSNGTFFTTVQQPFPSPVDRKLSTAQFLTAARHVVDLIDQCGGKVFAPVKYDMNGNIQKISVIYEEDELKFEYMNDMILIEQAQGRNTATEALLWLRRALQFIHSFFSSILEDTQINKKPEDLTENIQKAYKQTLEKYHGWMGKQLFNLLSRLVPCRSQILKAIALNEAVSEDIIFKDMEAFLNNLNSNITILLNFYAENNFESDAKSK